MKSAWIVFRKEWVDALRDRRTLLVVLLSSVAVGPLVMLLVSTLVAGLEQRSEARELMVRGLAHAPTLVNFLQRQSYTLREAPADYEQALRDNRLGEPVLVLADDFEAVLARGEPPVVQIVGSSGNNRARAAMSRVRALLHGFERERGVLRLAMWGVPQPMLDVVQVHEVDLAPPAARGAQLATMVPFFVLMAMVYGALNAALDSTAGERERGSLEPLLTNPLHRAELVLGKWAAVVAVAMLIALLSCLSFLPGQWLLRSETLAALFRFGVAEAASFVALLLPLAGALSALLMAIAIRCRTVKEAQANATIVVLLVSLLPLVLVFDQGGEKGWHLAVPGLAQVMLMGRLIRGEGSAAWEIALPVGAALLLMGACLAVIMRSLRQAARSG